MSPSIPSPEDLRATLARDGFVLIPSILTPTELQTYRTAAASATTLARTGQWPHIRTLPKQFPPWPAADLPNGIWGVQHLLHPRMPERKTFAHSYFHPAILSAITSLLDCSPDQLVLELYNMLIRPEHDFALRWHRDDIPPTASAGEEEARLQNEPMLHAQWNLALYPDSSLLVVPGSHARARTETERSADPYEASLPGQKAIRMEAGDVLFYNNNILHRGVYDCNAERMTLHGTMGLVGEDQARARNILQHGIGSWAGEADFTHLELGPGMEGVARGMQERLMRMGGGEDVGFSQSD